MKQKEPFDWEQLFEDWIGPLLIVALVVGFIILVSR